MLLVFIFRKSNDENDIDYDHLDDGKAINPIYDQTKDKLKPNLSFNQIEDEQFKKKKIARLNGIREKRLKEKKIWKYIREIAVYFMFISVVLIVCYSKRDYNSFNYQFMIKNLFKLNDLEVRVFEEYF